MHNRLKLAFAFVVINACYIKSSEVPEEPFVRQRARSVVITNFDEMEAYLRDEPFEEECAACGEGGVEDSSGMDTATKVLGEDVMVQGASRKRVRFDDVVLVRGSAQGACMLPDSKQRGVVLVTEPRPSWARMPVPEKRSVCFLDPDSNTVAFEMFCTKDTSIEDVLFAYAADNPEDAADKEIECVEMSTDSTAKVLNLLHAGHLYLRNKIEEDKK